MVLRRGTTLILSTLVLWMILATATGVATLLIGGLKVSGEVDASVVAIYAADAGIECYLREERIGPDLPCNGALPNGAAYEKIARDIVGSTVRIQATGTFRDANRGLEVTYKE